MGATTSLLTFEEFERLPDQPGKRELLKGELIEVPPADFAHNDIAHRIYERLSDGVSDAHARGEAPELGKVYHEMGYRLAADGYVQPDVSVTQAGQSIKRYLVDSPAIAIEVVSPSNTAEALDVKTALYFQYGAREVWRVYQKTRHVDIHVPGSSRTIGTDEVFTTPLLPGFAMSVAEILGV